MRRSSVLFSLVAILVVGLVVAGGVSPGRAAQQGTAPHPAVGAWVWDTDAADPANAPSYGVFHGDGTYVEAHPLVGVGLGAWRATGERTADLLIVFQDVDITETGVALGTLTIRAAVEVDATGNAIAAPFTSEGRARNGTLLFQGVLDAVATQIEVEPMTPPGTPAAGTTTGA
jgi:hypothetical protein